MSVRSWIIGLVALTSFIAAPAVRAGDFDKYVPEKSNLYVHISMPKFFTSELVRKTIPMVFDKHSDEIAVALAAGLKQVPNMPELPDEVFKEDLKKLANAEEIAKVCDRAKGVVTDIVIAGNPEKDPLHMVILFKSQFFTPQNFEMVTGMIAAQPQAPAQIQKIKKSAGTIYAMGSPQHEQRVYVTVPENGIAHMTLSEEVAEASLAAKNAPSEAFAKLINKKGAADFFFIAAIGDDEKEFSSVNAHIVLDKDLAGELQVDFKDAAKATDMAAEANEKLSKLLDQVTMILGKGGETAKVALGKTKAEVDGTTVKASLSIPGAAIEELLKKEKETADK